jgi:post-segregation antitoxin (ccd killing protein)
VSNLLNVRLDPEDQRLADELRADGLPISKLVRDAIRAEHERRLGAKRRKAKPSAIVADLFKRFPDQAGDRGHAIDTTDRRAVQKYIGSRLRAKR